MNFKPVITKDIFPPEANKEELENERALRLKAGAKQVFLKREPGGWVLETEWPELASKTEQS